MGSDKAARALAVLDGLRDAVRAYDTLGDRCSTLACGVDCGLVGLRVILAEPDSPDAGGEIVAMLAAELDDARGHARRASGMLAEGWWGGVKSLESAHQQALDAVACRAQHGPRGGE